MDEAEHKDSKQPCVLGKLTKHATPLCEFDRTVDFQPAYTKRIIIIIVFIHNIDHCPQAKAHSASSQSPSGWPRRNGVLVGEQ